MSASPAHIPAIFNPESFFHYPWRTEQVETARTASYLRQDDAKFLNSDNSRAAFDSDRDVILQDRLRVLGRQLDVLTLQLQKRLAFQPTAFHHVPLESILINTRGVALLLLASHPDKISVDATADASVFITAIYPRQRSVYLEIFFSENQVEPLETIVNIYDADGRCGFAYAGQPIETLRKTVAFLQTTFDLNFWI